MNHEELSVEEANKLVVLLKSEKTTLFNRLSSVLDLPVSELHTVFLETLDSEFEEKIKSLAFSLRDRVVTKSNVDELHVRMSGRGLPASSEEGSGTDDTSGRPDVRRSGVGPRQYVRPNLPIAPQQGAPLGADYMATMSDTLLYAFSHGDSVLVERIIQECPSVVACLKTEEFSALLHSDHSLPTLQTLLHSGEVDPNTLDKYGSTLLHKHVRDKNVEFIKMLLQHGADCNIEDKRNQRSPVQLAALHGDFEALYTLATGSQVPVKLDKPDFDGNSLLHLVLQSEFPDVQYKSITMFLLDRGLSPGAKNLYGATPVHYFCVNQSLCGISFIEPLFELLLEALPHEATGVNLLDDDHCTPLIIACAHREWELCTILIRNGADMNIPCSMSSALLTRGCDTSRSELVDFESDCTTGDLMPRSVRRKIFPHICSAQSLIAPSSRDRCMNCAMLFPPDSPGFNLFSPEPKTHCRNCGRVVCVECIVQSDLPFHELPDYLKESSDATDDIRVCVVCHPILSRDIKVDKFW